MTKPDALIIEGLVTGYGRITVLRDISLTVSAGQIVALLGANGAGKTTLLRAVSGLLPSRGSIVHNGDNISGLAADQIVSRGIAHVPQGRGTFPALTVEENLRVGATTVRGTSVSEDIDKWFEFFPRLRERRKQVAGGLSGGEQQMLAIARAMMSHPSLLLLDELSLGLAPKITAELFGELQRINIDENVAVLIVEQNAQLALQIASSAFVLENGRITINDAASVLLKDDRVRKSYLGT